MIQQRFHIEPVVQFRNKSMLLYDHFHRTGAGFVQSKAFASNAKKLVERKKYTGQISPGARKRLTKAVSLLIQSAASKWVLNPATQKQQYHRLSFITLTLPDVDQAKDAKFAHKHLLQPWLRIMRNKYGMRTYIWKAELQENGSIHYHITTDQFILYHHIRNVWNNIVRKHGLLHDFKERYGHDNPNSTDIHAVAKIKDLEAYIIKYVTKESQNGEALAGKVWDCSKNLKACSYFTTTETNEIRAQIRQDIKDGHAVAFEAERFTIIKYKYEGYYLSFSQELINKYYSHLSDVRSWQYLETSSTMTSTTKSVKSSQIMKTQKKHLRKDKKKRLSHNSNIQYQMFKTSVYGHTSSARSTELPKEMFSQGHIGLRPDSCSSRE